jgi:hypothetical protein
MWQKDQPVSVWDHLPYWEFEEFIKLMNDRNKEEEKEQKKQEEDQKSQMPDWGSFNPNNIGKNFQTPNYKQYLK